jgi:hypothetical protein
MGGALPASAAGHAGRLPDERPGAGAWIAVVVLS